MTWSKTWTASESVVDSDSADRVIRDFILNGLTTRGFTVQEPPTDNVTDGADNNFFLTKTYTLFGGRSHTAHSRFFKEDATTDINYGTWEGDASEIIDGIGEPSSNTTWGLSQQDLRYSGPTSSHYGIWEMWESDQDAHSLMLFGGGAGNKYLIGFQEPEDTRFGIPGRYNNWLISDEPLELMLPSSSSAFKIRSMTFGGNVSAATTGFGPYLINYPTICAKDSSGMIWGRVSTNDWLEYSSTDEDRMTTDVSATSYDGDNYIKIGGSPAWLLNTAATVPFA